MDSVTIMRNFLASIFNRAITDWFKHTELRDEIREFFESKWCNELCIVLDLSAKDILRKLESGEINYHIVDDEEGE